MFSSAGKLSSVFTPSRPKHINYRKGENDPRAFATEADQVEQDTFDVWLETPRHFLLYIKIKWSLPGIYTIISPTPFSIQGRNVMEIAEMRWLLVALGSGVPWSLAQF